MEFLLVFFGLVVGFIIGKFTKLFDLPTKNTDNVDINIKLEGSEIEGPEPGLLTYGLQYRAGIINYDEYYTLLKKLEEDGLIDIDVDEMFDKKHDITHPDYEPPFSSVNKKRIPIRKEIDDTLSSIIGIDIETDSEIKNQIADKIYNTDYSSMLKEQERIADEKKKSRQVQEELRRKQYAKSLEDLTFIIQELEEERENNGGRSLLENRTSESLVL